MGAGGFYRRDMGEWGASIGGTWGVKGSGGLQ